MPEKSATPTPPDLRSLLREATKATSQVSVPLKQGLAAQIRAAEAALASIAPDVKPERMGAKSPLKAAAEKVAALEAEMAASVLTFHFEAPTAGQRESLRVSMEGRDDSDEIDLRATAACLVKVTGPDGSEYADRLDWTDLHDLRESLGVMVYDATIKAASDEVWGTTWSVPFSPSASLILGTAR